MFGSTADIIVKNYYKSVYKFRKYGIIYTPIRQLEK